MSDTEIMWEVRREMPFGWRWIITVIEPDGRRSIHTRAHFTKRSAMRASERIAITLGWRFK